MIRTLLVPILALVVLATPAWAANAPKGPPESYLGDPIPTPLRTLWVDRCGRGNAGTCGSVSCSSSSGCGTTKNTPCCSLKDIQLISGGLQPGDQINVRAGTSAADGYWEVDDGGGKWAISTMSPTVKGTALCVAGAHAGWVCSSDADCPSSTCDYRPIVLKGFVEGDGSVPHIDPSGHGVAATGGTQCNAIPGRYIGIGFSNPGCLLVSNDHKQCYGGSTEGKPCTTTADCTGATACASAPWHWILDGLTFTNWSDFDTDLTHTPDTHRCTMQPLQIGTVHGCSAGETVVGVTVQNCDLYNDDGAGVLLAEAAGAVRFFHNTVHDNETHGYSSPIDTFLSREGVVGRSSYIWGNVSWNNLDVCPPWSNATMCLPSGTPPTFTCTGGPLDGTPCTAEVQCGSGGHCGLPCKWDAFHNTAPGPQGYTCQCNANGDCATGLTCQVQPGHFGCPNGDTEGKCIIIDTSNALGIMDIRNNLCTSHDGDCISVLHSDLHGVIANNSCYHNTKKGGSSYNEFFLIGNNVAEGNNIFVPDPAETACDQGSTGGQTCATPLTISCPGGAWCQASGFVQFDSPLGYTITPATISSDNDLIWFNSPGLSANPPDFQFAGGQRGTLQQYQAYGALHGLHRGLNTIAADPQFLSVTPTDPLFLHIPASSPAVGAGLASLAPAFDQRGRARPNPPSIGAFEPDGSTTTTIAPPTSTTVSTSSTTTTSSVTTTTIGSGAPNDWTAESDTVAWYPLDIDYTNHATSTTWCNPVSDADLHIGNHPESLSLVTDAVQGSHSLFNSDSLGQLLADNALRPPHDCLRSQQPAPFTITGWWKQTADVPGYQYPQILRDQNDDNSPTGQVGWLLQISPRNLGRLTACFGVQPTTNCDPVTAVSSGGTSVIPIDSQWHFVSFGWNGTGLFIGAEGIAQRWVGPAAAMQKNATPPTSSTFTFEYPHAPGAYGGVIGNQDALWWVGRTLSTQQACRARAVHPTGERGWCSGASWAACTTDADCNNRVGACNATFHQCVGLLSGTGPTGCQAVADLGACNATLAGGVIPTTTTTTTVPTTTSTVTTVPVVFSGMRRKIGPRYFGQRVR